MNPADLIAEHWYVTEIQLDGKTRRTSTGIVRGEPTIVEASVSAGARLVTNQHGEEVLTSATVKWHIDGPLPSPTDTITLPEDYGLAPSREVVTARRVRSGTGLTPDHVEVTLK